MILGDEAAFAKRFLRNCKGKTAGVFNNAREYGWLPHPPARLQEAIVREAGVDGELALACLAATAKKAPASQKRGPPVPQKPAKGEVVELSDDDDELVVAPPKRQEPASRSPPTRTTSTPSSPRATRRSPLWRGVKARNDGRASCASGLRVDAAPTASGPPWRRPLERGPGTARGGAASRAG